MGVGKAHHLEIVVVHESLLALAAVVVIFMLMLNHLLPCRPCIVAHRTLPSEVI